MSELPGKRAVMNELLRRELKRTVSSCAVQGARLVHVVLLCQAVDALGPPSW